MIKNFLIGFVLFCALAVALLGTRGEHSTAPPIEFFGDMKRQSKVKFQKPSDFFADGRAARPPLQGTIPMGYDIPGHPTQNSEVPNDISSPLGEFTAGTDYYNTGKMGDHWGTGIPLEVSRELMQRGQQRFNITCAMCHGAAAAGNGIVKQHGLATVVSLQDERIRKMSDGEIFNTITNGKNTMMAYGPTIIVPDRWAIIAYLRALQRSQNAAIADVPEEHRPELEKK